MQPQDRRRKDIRETARFRYRIRRLLSLPLSLLWRPRRRAFTVWRRQAQWSSRARLLGLLSLLLALPGSGPAHAVTYLEQIERLQAVYGALLDYRPAALPGPRPAGWTELGLEVDPLPPIDNTVGAKREPVSPPPAVVRGRFDWSPHSGLRLGAFLIPPVTVERITANVAGVEAELGWSADALHGSLRAYTLSGSVTGPITEPGARDRFLLSGSGADVRVGWALRAWMLYGGLGLGDSRTRLQVASDGADIASRRATLYGFAGLGWTHEAWSLIAEQHRTTDYLSHLVLAVTYGF